VYVRCAGNQLMGLGTAPVPREVTTLLGVAPYLTKNNITRNTMTDLEKEMSLMLLVVLVGLVSFISGTCGY